MKIAEVVDSLKEKVNKNAINDGAEIDNPRAISLINEEQNKFLAWVLEKRNEDDIRKVERFLVAEKNLKIDSKTLSSNYYTLPENFFDFANISARAKEGKCTDDILLWEVKSENVHELLEDTNNKPSFYYRESFYYFTESKVRIFKNNFEIVKVLLDYYRYPKKMDIEGYLNIEGTASSNVDPEWGDKEMDVIINMAARSFNLNSENLQRFQIDTARINSKN